jgi:hypothetical protein
MPRKKTVKSSGNVTYVHNKGFIQGLPARDMDYTEWMTYPEDLRQTGLAAGIYVIGESEVEEMELEVEE